MLENEREKQSCTNISTMDHSIQIELYVILPDRLLSGHSMFPINKLRVPFILF